MSIRIWLTVSSASAWRSADANCWVLTLSGPDTSSTIFPRCVTTPANAFVQPLMSAYLEKLQQELTARGFTGALRLMHSAGGLMSPQTACAFPIRLLESGPAGGGLATAWFGQLAGRADKHHDHCARLIFWKAGSGIGLPDGPRRPSLHALPVESASVAPGRSALLTAGSEVVEPGGLPTAARVLPVRHRTRGRGQALSTASSLAGPSSNHALSLGPVADC